MELAFSANQVSWINVEGRGQGSVSEGKTALSIHEEHWDAQRGKKPLQLARHRTSLRHPRFSRQEGLLGFFGTNPPASGLGRRALSPKVT
jgi:hypothetical protein